MIRRLARRPRLRDRLLAAAPAAAQLNLYCSSPNTAWCQGMAIGFEKATGVKVAVVQKATGEMLAQVKAERANPKGDIWWAGPGDAYLQAAEDGLLETYRVAEPRRAARLGAADLGGLAEPRLRRLRRHPRARLQHRAADEEEAAGPEVLEGPARSRLQERGDARQPELLRHRVPDAGVAGAGVRRGRGVQVHEGAQRQRELVRALGHRADDGGQAGRDLRRQHRAARRDQRDRRRLPGQARAPLRGRRLRDRVDGDHQGRAQPRQREEVRRLGADRRRAEDRARRQGVRDPDQQERAAAGDGAEPDRHTRSSTTTSRSTASSETRKRLLERWEKEINGRNRAGDRQPACADARAHDRAPRIVLARRRRGRLPPRAVVRAAGQRVRARLDRRSSPTKEAAPALLQIAAARQGLARAARRCCSVARHRSRRSVRERRGARERADRRRRDRLRLPASRRASRSARPGGTSSRWRRACRRCRAGNSAWGSARRSSSRRSACCSRSGSPDAATSRATPFVAASVVAVAALVAVFTFFPVVRILVSALQDGDGAFSLVALPERLFAEKIWGLGCIAGGTRCGVAWNTLAARVPLRGRLHRARPRLRADRHPHRVQAQAGAARPHHPADHHAAVRDRPRPHPDLRPLGPRQPVARVRCSAGSSGAGSTACRACWSRRCSRSRRSPSSC